MFERCHKREKKVGEILCRGDDIVFSYLPKRGDREGWKSIDEHNSAVEVPKLDGHLSGSLC